MKSNHKVLSWWPTFVVPCIAMMCASGCVEPNYRNEVTANAQGGVEVHRVAKDEPSSSNAAPASPVARPMQPTAAPAEATGGQSIDERIAALEAQAAKIDEEITKLKLEKAAGSRTP